MVYGHSTIPPFRDLYQTAAVYDRFTIFVCADGIKRVVLFSVNSAILGVDASGVLVKFGRFLSAVDSKLVRVLASIKDISISDFRYEKSDVWTTVCGDARHIHNPKTLNNIFESSCKTRWCLVALISAQISETGYIRVH